MEKNLEWFVFIEQQPRRLQLHERSSQRTKICTDLRANYLGAAWINCKTPSTVYGVKTNSLSASNIVRAGTDISNIFSLELDGFDYCIEIQSLIRRVSSLVDPTLFTTLSRSTATR